MPNELMSPDLEWTETTIVHLRFDQIDPNPFRDLVNNPLTEPQVAALERSVRSTGYWHNSVVRPHPKARGRYQLAYGHARLEAARLVGITAASFTVQQLDDDTMLRMMANENITQFGKDRFATYKEATVAAATLIMREVLADPKRADKFISTKPAPPEELSKLVNSIVGGGCPGRETIAYFYEGTLNPNNIQAALQVWQETGELAAWHRKHNPQAVKHVERKLDPEALRLFAKTDHVRAFVKAVEDTDISIADQKPLAEQILASLAPAPDRSLTGRETFQSDEDSDYRFNSKNIRAQVVKAAAAQAQSEEQKARYERMDQMTTLERALVEFDTGLTRTLRGYQSIAKVLSVIGSVTQHDMTATALKHVQQARQTLGELETLLAQPMARKLLRIKGGKQRGATE